MTFFGDVLGLELAHRLPERPVALLLDRRARAGDARLVWSVPEPLLRGSSLRLAVVEQPDLDDPLQVLQLVFERPASYRETSRDSSPSAARSSCAWMPAASLYFRRRPTAICSSFSRLASGRACARPGVCPCSDPVPVRNSITPSSTLRMRSATCGLVKTACANATAAASQAREDRPAGRILRLHLRSYCRAIAIVKRSSGDDQVVVVVLLQVDLDPVHLAAELVAARAVVRRHRRAVLLADVAGLVAREGHRHGLLDAALADRLAVHEERHAAALGQAAAVVLELHPHLVLAGRDRLCRLRRTSR